jgi:hypothetical protein
MGRNPTTPELAELNGHNEGSIIEMPYVPTLNPVEEAHMRQMFRQQKNVRQQKLRAEQQVEALTNQEKDLNGQLNGAFQAILALKGEEPGRWVLNYDIDTDTMEVIPKQ